MPVERFVSPQLARALTELSFDIGRRIGLLINRSGEIELVVVGDAHRLHLPDLGRIRAGAGRFRGVRLLATTLRPESLTEDELTDLALLRLDAVASVEVLPGGLPGKVHVGLILPPEEGEHEARTRVEMVPSVAAWEEDWLALITDLEAQFSRSPVLKIVAGGTGAILIGVTLDDSAKAQRGIAELARLAQTAGLHVIEQHVQRRQKLDGRTCVGSGKLQELLLRAMHTGAEVLVFDRELTPSQLRNVATVTDLKVLDRTQLILDIFAQHAKTHEGRLQVELAQLRYAMPRLKIMPTAMSRLTGGIGGRGPGETKLEINRRRAQERLVRVQRDLDEHAQHRETRRGRRQRSNIPIVGIVGYTNAGKSTLLNKLTHSEVLVEDQLFATLDTTTRRLRFPEEREIVLTDTVGFIEDLPDTLLQAFKGTLEELEEADLLLHVLDASDSSVTTHKEAVEQVLTALGLDQTPILHVWNKADIIGGHVIRELREIHGGLPVSALTGEGLDELLLAIERAIFRGQRRDAIADTLASTPPLS